MSTKKSLRFDRSTLDDIRRDHNGYLVAKASVTRTGVFVYRHADGSTTRELRHPDEVFKADSLATLKNRPVTFGHPAEGRLTSKNTKYLSVGNAIDDVKHDEKFVSTVLQVTDEDTIDSIMDENKPIREISCGYDAEVVKQDGEFNGERYDHVQKNIVYNHIAIVKRGRAGSAVRLQLDHAQQDEMDYKVAETDDRIDICISSDSYQSSSTNTRDVTNADGVKLVYTSENDNKTIRSFTFAKSSGWTIDKAKAWTENHRNDSADKLLETKEPTPMTTKVKIKRDAISTKTFKADAFEVVLDGTAEASEKAIDLMNARQDAMVAHIQNLEAQNQALQGKLDSMADQNNLSAVTVGRLAKERADVERIATAVGLSNFDKMETLPLKKAIVMKCSKRDSLNGVELTEAYIQGRYDGIVQELDKKSRNRESLMQLSGGIDPSLIGLTATDDDGASPREKFLADTADMWKGDKERKAAH